MHRAGLLLGLLALGAPAGAQQLPVCGPAATVLHAEGAPADRVVMRNISQGAWGIARASIDLAGSAGRLIFDTVPDGAGTNVAQPFRPAGGAAVLAAPPAIPDGAEAMSLAFAAFPPGARFGFTIDLDDRLTARPGPTVAGAETAGARFTVTFRHADGTTETHEGPFDERGGARAAAPCVS
jgi:hypothetical protein